MFKKIQKQKKNKSDLETFTVMHFTWPGFYKDIYSAISLVKLLFLENKFRIGKSDSVST